MLHYLKRNPVLGIIGLVAMGTAAVGTAVYYHNAGKVPVAQPPQALATIAPTPAEPASKLEPKDPVRAESKTPGGATTAVQARTTTTAPPNDEISAATTAVTDSLQAPENARIGAPKTPALAQEHAAISVSARSLSQISNDLFAATKDADSSIQLGPFTACFDQARAIACPIVGSIPIVKDIVGMISLELGISCPMGTNSTSTRI